MSVFSVAMAYSIAAGKTIYVDASAPPGGNGQSWGTAYKYLQDALAAAIPADKIWVAAGTYKPDEVRPGGLDAFVGNDNQANKVWLNDGQGNFSNSGQSLGSSESYDVELGDVDGDGDLDAFVASSGSQANKVWLNHGQGTFSDSGQNLGSSYSYDAELGDLDGDGDLDAFVANIGANKVWLNHGYGNFSDSGQNLGNSYSHDVELGDVDDDGDLDAFVANWNQANQANKVWLNDGQGMFSDSGQSLDNSPSCDVKLGDVDGDGDLDAFVANWNRADKVWLNDGEGMFSNSGQSLGNDILDSFDVDLGDVDGDGDLDAFVANTSYQANKVWLNDGHGMFSDSGQSLGGSRSYDAELGDVDGDGDLDAFVVNWNQANKVWLNDGQGMFSDSGQSLGSSESRDVALGDLDGDGVDLAGDRTATFQLISGVGIYGGFPSGGGTWEQRNPDVHETILSGDINTSGYSLDNSYHVVNGSGTNATAILDGFTITGGNADGSWPYDGGGGMYNGSGRPTVTNCTLIGNSALYGAGMHNYSESSPTVTGCIFSGNTAVHYGGGMYNSSNSSPAVVNCSFSGNGAAEQGGGMTNYNNSSPTVTNCAFSGNSGAFVGGIYNVNTSEPTITNCIFWRNSPRQIFDYNSTSLVTYSDVGGGWSGAGNINADPMFVDADGADDIMGTADDNLRLMEGSPCIDGGDNNSVPADVLDLDGDADTTEPIPFDLDGRPRITDGDCNSTEIVDMGAYEFAWAYIGDFDGECNVDFVDFAILVGYWMGDEPLVDIAPPPDGDGIVDSWDLAVLCNNWLAGVDN